MAYINVYAADTDTEARRLFTSLEQAFIALRKGRPVPLPPPRGVVSATGVDELMTTAMIYDQGARLRSFEIIAGVRE